MVEVRRNIPFAELKEIRRQFGSGNAGRSAFRIIAKGAKCEGFIDSQNGKSDRCNKPAQFTLDFDVPRVNCLEQIPTCIGCKDGIESSIKRDYGRERSFFSFSVNGRGRS